MINNTKCRICEGKKLVKLVEKGGKDYLKCEKCGVTFMYPYPSEKELKEYYEDDYTNRKVEGTGLHIRFKDAYKPVYKEEKDLTLKDLKINIKNFEGKSLLDVGCANGIFLEYLKGFNINTKGIDISEDMVDMAKKNGLNCTNEDVFDINEKYDIITIWDVLEHVLEPRKMIEKCYDLLNDEGTIIIQTPCTGIISEKFGRNWRNYVVPQHIFLFSQEGLFKLIKGIGFDDITWVRFGSGNTKGTIPNLQKKVFDSITKELKIGDSIALSAKKRSKK